MAVTWLPGPSPRPIGFKAAVAGAGLNDLASEFGTEGGSSYDEWFFGSPYEKPEGFIKSSPIT